MAKEGVEEALLLASRATDGGRDEGLGLGVRDEVKKQLWLAGPLIAGALLQNLIQMISVMYVGHLGELALAGASMASSFATVTGFSLLDFPLFWATTKRYTQQHDAQAARCNQNIKYSTGKALKNKGRG
uniref:Protein TRANSPARENT TESTA 12 n=1 Tax=Aegilops tauschii TaxID=37682 RepID=R7WDX5_AEGTA